MVERFNYTFISNSFSQILTNLCVISLLCASCHCEGKRTDHLRPWQEAVCRPPSPLPEQTGQNRGEPWFPKTKQNKKQATLRIYVVSHLLSSAAGSSPVYASRRGAVCRALHHFDGKGLLIHAGAGVACYSTYQTADTNLESDIQHPENCSVSGEKEFFSK